MEDDRRWELITLRNELLQGMEAARKLMAEFRTESSVEARDFLVQRILSSYEKALLILKWNASNTNPLPMGTVVTGLPPESPISVNAASPFRDDIDGDHPDLKTDSKKRKMMPTWMERVRSSSETALEGPQDDGFSWRKYGQKDILGAKYPRSYYRCTFRKTQNCWATKQIQRSDEDPTVFDITYRGRHTCSLGNNAVQPPKSPDQQEKMHTHESHTRQHEPSLQENLMKFRKNLSVNTDNLKNEEIANPFTFLSTSSGYMTPESHNLPPLPQENDPFWGDLSQTDLLSPNTPQSNYLPSLSFKMDEFHGIKNQPCSESDITEIISANTSASNSPILDFNFPIDPVEIDPNFPFDTPGLFP